MHTFFELLTHIENGGHIRRISTMPNSYIKKEYFPSSDNVHCLAKYTNGIIETIFTLGYYDLTEKDWEIVRIGE